MTETCTPCSCKLRPPVLFLCRGPNFGSEIPNEGSNRPRQPGYTQTARIFAPSSAPGFNPPGPGPASPPTPKPPPPHFPETPTRLFPPLKLVQGLPPARRRQPIPSASPATGGRRHGAVATPRQSISRFSIRSEWGPPAPRRQRPPRVDLDPEFGAEPAWQDAQGTYAQPPPPYWWCALRLQPLTANCAVEP